MIDINTGREIPNYEPKKSEDIQVKMNQMTQMPNEIRQEVPKKEIKEIEKNLDYAVDGSSYSGFGFNNNTFIENTDDAYRNRTESYNTYQQMSEHNFIHRGLSTIADDSCQKNIEGNTVKVYSDDDDIKDILEDLFHKRLNMNKELWSIVYSTCKFGDNFYEVIPDSYENPKEIVRIRYLDPYKTSRIEKNGKLVFYTYTTDYVPEDDKDLINSKDKQQVQYKLQPWQVIHFRINDKDFYPYGGSILKAGVRSFRRLTMLEDAMTIYRIARVPERRVFNIGVGNLSTAEANRYVQRIKDSYRSQQILDERGNINRSASALSLTQDIFIPVREGETGTKIESLPPGTGLQNIDDIRYFRDELLWTMNIPPSYLGFLMEGTGGGEARGSLAMQDIKFSRYIERIQSYIEEGLVKIAAIELFFKKKRREELKDFRIEMTPPSNIKEVMDIEYLNQKMQLIQTMQATQIFSNSYILKYVMKMPKKEIDSIIMGKQIETQTMNPAAGGMDMGMGGMGAAPMGDMGMGAAPMGAAPMDTGIGGGMASTETAPAQPTQTLNQEFVVDAFGKEVIVENKADFAMLVKMAKQYKKDKESGLFEEKEEDISDDALISKIKEVFGTNKEKEKTNIVAESLYYSNEFAGLNFDKKEFTVYTKPKKRSGPKSKKAPDVVIEEAVRKLK